MIDPTFGVFALVAMIGIGVCCCSGGGGGGGGGSGCPTLDDTYSCVQPTTGAIGTWDDGAKECIYAPAPAISGSYSGTGCGAMMGGMFCLPAGGTVTVSASVDGGCNCSVSFSLYALCLVSGSFAGAEVHASGAACDACTVAFGGGPQALSPSSASASNSYTLPPGVYMVAFQMAGGLSAYGGGCLDWGLNADFTFAITGAGPMGAECCG